MKTKQTRGKGYLSLVSALLMVAPAAAFANEQDCLSLINQITAQNDLAILDDAVLLPAEARLLNQSAASTLFAQATSKCADLPNGAVVVSDLGAAAGELVIAADLNGSEDTISASAHEATATVYFEVADTDVLIGL